MVNKLIIILSIASSSIYSMNLDQELYDAIRFGKIDKIRINKSWC